MKGTRNAWIELASWNKQGDPDYREQVGLIHPEALIHLAELLQVKLPKMPVCKAPAEVEQSKLQSAA